MELSLISGHTTNVSEDIILNTLLKVSVFDKENHEDHITRTRIVDKSGLEHRRERFLIPLLSSHSIMGGLASPGPRQLAPRHLYERLE